VSVASEVVDSLAITAGAGVLSNPGGSAFSESSVLVVGLLAFGMDLPPFFISPATDHAGFP
jgi:hypothetical protein